MRKASPLNSGQTGTYIEHMPVADAASMLAVDDYLPSTERAIDVMDSDKPDFAKV